MLTLEERIARTKEKVRQLENQRTVENKSEKNAVTFDADTRRQNILGWIDTEYFPWLLKLQPQATESENQVEFAPWACFLALLASDENYVNQLMEKVAEAFPEVK